VGTGRLASWKYQSFYLYSIHKLIQQFPLLPKLLQAQKSFMLRGREDKLS
jgi:hypothetical protein